MIVALSISSLLLMLSVVSWHVQAGTLSGNPLAMVAGIKTLEILDRPGAYEYMTKITKRLTDGILKAGRDAGHEVTGGCISGMPVCPGSFA